MIRKNFLWLGGDGLPTRAKVAWSLITLPTSWGGLGLVDPAWQSTALLGKFVVCCLLPGSEPWKELLLHRSGRCTPKMGVPWQPEVHPLFVEMRRERLSCRTKDQFVCLLLKTWEMLRLALGQLEPSRTEEFLRQPLVRNPLVRTLQGHMVRSRPHVS